MTGDEQAKKIKELEKALYRLELIVDQLNKRVDYLDRERQRTKSDVQQIVQVIRK